MKYAPPLPLTVAVLALPALLAWGCSGRTEEREKQNAALQQQNKQMAQNMTTQDEYIDDVVTAINEVYQNIEAARASENRPEGGCAAALWPIQALRCGNLATL